MSLFAFGLGYSAARVAARGRLGPVTGTTRDTFGDLEGVAAALKRAGVALVSVPPDAQGDPTLRLHAHALRDAGLRRIVYLSTVGVYGDSGGEWVDEDSPLLASTPRARARVAAEAEWTAFGLQSGVAVDVLRLGGIYGPGRSAFDKLREGTARRIVKPGQAFNRIHVDDIASAVEGVTAAGRPGAVYNVVDGEPAPPQDVILFAATLLGVAPPPEEPFATAGLTGMARSFYDENRRVRCDRLKALGWSPDYPSYREGLTAIRAQERAGG